MLHGPSQRTSGAPTSTELDRSQPDPRQRWLPAHAAVFARTRRFAGAESPPRALATRRRCHRWGTSFAATARTLLKHPSSASFRVQVRNGGGRAVRSADPAAAGWTTRQAHLFAGDLMPTHPKSSLDALLASFHAARDVAERSRIAMALVRRPVRDERTLAALVRVLGENPVGGAAFLSRYGDGRAIPDLVRALESDDLLAKADCAICAAEQLSAIAHAIERLGGTLTDGQRARLDRIDREAARLWQPGPDAFPPEAFARRPARREPRPGRNVPCPCGSGKKYKRCCALEADTAGELH
jgi:hypothetical protein